MTAAFKQRLTGGGFKFTCTDCGFDIYQSIDDGFDFPVCATCRWLGERPQIDKRTADRLRGKER